MPVELRKRQAPAEPAPPPPAKKKSNPIKKVADKAKAALAGKTAAAAPAASTTNGNSSPAIKGGTPAVGSTIELNGFGGVVKTHEGIETDLAKLVADSKSGVVLFTYPKASTPGCTKQACMFRDEYAPLTATGYAIYGLSRDSPNANTTFVTKQSLPYPLLCDPNASLISAIGLKKAPAGTTRGVFVVDKSGKVLAAEPGSPDGTVAVVRKLVAGPGASAAPMEGVKTDESAAPASAAVDQPAAPAVAENPSSEAALHIASKDATAASAPSVPGGALENPAKDAAVAKVAAEVADSAQKVDPAPGPTENAGATKDAALASVAAEVADTAQKVDPATPNPA